MPLYVALYALYTAVLNESLLYVDYCYVKIEFSKCYQFFMYFWCMSKQ